MTSRRDFVKKSVLAGLASAVPAGAVSATDNDPVKTSSRKHWVWINPNAADKDADLVARYRQYYEAGIRAIFFEADSEKHYRIAKSQKLEAHRWMWTMNRGEKSLLSAHPEWYSRNRKGESCADKPPYVNYYRWLCPSREEVKQYLEADVKSILAKDYVDGIHLDYVRFCDVILPVNLWANYKLDQTKELPEYDYCYCEVCRAGFKEWRGEDISAIQYPEASLSWRLFRYQAITNVVNRLAKVANSYKKPITAAVFPTPEVARRNVRQDWVNWNLDGVCPMIYHGFYKEPVAWIGDAVHEGVNALHGKYPLYAGIYLPDFKNPQEVKQGIEYALKNGAAGVSIFGNVTPEVLYALKTATV
ncbi:family 10 glycosylhydrolase [Hufsiella ginkgonis]|uniref:Family 10 glycosylhydrolase n=1 Tax=Hufsiella ginkgonis TaxID=2695274 RepID=A0A7K1Y060_9SPHI|nr:family 10 glycosylhydrolase [Hufsiella ginkgonis]MXV16438.1 family 10 glycosylhydrolase [Hufsiella ginkgonis]